uniref:THO complex subunit 4D-like n=1 Tax=Tanacetum cinerariifolium TaxID=118510 RepID=A0A6L2MMA5_TANCI|nr:THO complex subunit 4D-like [Tanacetum cinerariifolium]GEU75103.1 THO complex subunit 4D-like [Tanacetum cinerariifolium]
MASMDMSLEDIIKSRRATERAEKGGGRGKARLGRGQGGPSGNGRPTGKPRKGPLRVNARPSAQTIAKTFRTPKSMPWKRDLLEESLKATGLPGLDDGAKLYVSNLDIGVTNEDIRELFSEIGELKRYAIHYDKSGRPNGTAEVMFTRRSDAFQARKRYNNVQLDGKPMKIEIVGSKSDVPLAPRVNVVGGVNGQRTVVMMPGVGRGRGGAAINRISGQKTRGAIKNGRGGTMNGRGGAARQGGGARQGRGGGRGQGGGRGRGRGKKPAVNKSADELDKELENYHAMQT